MQPQPVASCLSADKRGMDRIMLEVVVSGCVTTPSDISQFVRCTLLSAAHSEAAPVATPAPCGAAAPHRGAAWQQAVVDGCRTSLTELGDQGFIEWVKPEADAPEGDKGQFRPCKLGRAAVAAGLQPLDALMMNEDVHLLARAVNLESDLHLMFLVAPVAPSAYLDWQHVHRVLAEAQRKRPVVRKVCELSQVKLSVAAWLARSGRKGWKPEVRTRSCARELRSAICEKLQCACNAVSRPASPLCSGRRLWTRQGATPDAVLHWAQKGEYVHGQRTKPDENRKLSKLYQALVLEAVVDEMPIDDVLRQFFPAEACQKRLRTSASRKR